MAHYFPRSCELPAAADVNSLGVRMREHCRVDQALVVNELVQLCRLRVPVHNEGPAEWTGINHLHKLKIGLLRKRDGLQLALCDKIGELLLFEPESGSDRRRILPAASRRARRGDLLLQCRQSCGKVIELVANAALGAPHGIGANGHASGERSSSGERCAPGCCRKHGTDIYWKNQ